MDYLSNLEATNTLIATGIFGAVVAFVAMFGLFSRKNQMPVEGRTVLLTGASEGMGLAVATQLAAKGANLILVARNVGRLEEALLAVKAAAASPSSQRFTYISADVSETDFAARVIAEAIAWNSGAPPDIVWNIAGLSTPLLWTHDDALPAARNNMSVNFFGAAELSHAILREWLVPVTPAISGTTTPPAAKPEPKHLIFTSSVIAFFPIPGYATYAPSKHALRGLADTLAMEMSLYPDTPVKIHIVCPGTITSPGLERENMTKPGITLEIEGEEEPSTPEEVARKSIAGLESGNYFVTVSLLNWLMQCGITGASPRNSWVMDTVLGWLMPIVYYFVLGGMHKQIARWGREKGHPGTGTKRV
ncbi:3-ketodihydrosphingosine reductase tsc-10 [Cercophora newfieldiana]|uniref:3-dehydrosphinganine reductase n=1 Tax=Cercophora newfieldiana TaxID=92897 RepID=A0AA39Y4V3_9PEZI|nr:3-ketodihydrosphingosine reductase tsc-10 [Cercophora newfieldiana]